LTLKQLRPTSQDTHESLYRDFTIESHRFAQILLFRAVGIYAPPPCLAGDGVTSPVGIYAYVIVGEEGFNPSEHKYNT
jgi:hypothetical protein